MEIGSEWKIESDSLNVILYRKRGRIKKDTKESCEAWERVGYYATVAGALHGLVNQGVRETELKDLKTVVEKIAELHALIDTIGIPP